MHRIAVPRVLARTFTVGAVVGSVLGTGCFGDGVAYLEAEDVEVEPVRATAFRVAGAQEYGDVYVIGMQGAHDVNGWVGAGVDAVGQVVRKLDKFPASSRDGDWKVYGPAKDLGGKSLSWMLKIAGDSEESRFEAWVGPRGADEGDMDLMLSGSVLIADSHRSGDVMIDFDVIEKYGDELKAGPQVDQTYTGKVQISFDRDLESELKHVDLDYENFTVTQEIPVPDYFSATSYAFHRNEDGSGDFHVEIAATFQALLWSGPEVETALLDMEWNENGAGWAKGQMLESEEEGDLTYGDLVIDECFDDHGALVWRQLNEAYQPSFPEYGLGSAKDCAIEPAR